MAKKTSEPEKSSKTAGRGKREVAATQFKLKAVIAKSVAVKHHDAPPPFEKRQSIHRRRLLPRVKEGKERAFHSVTREIALTLQRALPVGQRANTDDRGCISAHEYLGVWFKQCQVYPQWRQAHGRSQASLPRISSATSSPEFLGFFLKSSKWPRKVVSAPHAT